MSRVHTGEGSIGVFPQYFFPQPPRTHTEGVLVLIRFILNTMSQHYQSSEPIVDLISFETTGMDDFAIFDDLLLSDEPIEEIIPQNSITIPANNVHIPPDNPKSSPEVIIDLDDSLLDRLIDFDDFDCEFPIHIIVSCSNHCYLSFSRC